MTKADIIRYIYERIGIPRKDCAAAVETIFESMKERLTEGERVKISGFGSFIVRKKAARMGRNLRTKEAIPIGERRSITFKPSQILKAALKENSGTEAARAPEKALQTSEGHEE